MKTKTTTRSAFAYATFGIQLAIFMLIFVYGGYKLDLYLNSDPWFLILGAALGMCGGMYNLIKGLKQIEHISEQGGIKNGKSDKYKWL